MIPIRDTAPCHSKPLVTWGIMAVCIIIFLAMELMPDQISYRLINLYGMVPIRYSDPEWSENYGLPFDGYLSFLTSLFLHGGWLHLIVNMWFLWIFSPSIEDRMGRLPFFIFYLLCGLLATVLQWYFDPRLAIPVVGASGAIAGILGAYFFIYPMEQVVVFFFPRSFSYPRHRVFGIMGNFSTTGRHNFNCCSRDDRRCRVVGAFGRIYRRLCFVSLLYSQRQSRNIKYFHGFKV